MSEHISEQIDISLLVCTYNRCADLRDLLHTALVQETNGEFNFEVLVVDNNSTDETRKVVESFVDAGHENVRYLFEGKQGKSNALNSGLKFIRGRFYAIVDDDFVLPPNWALELVRGFRAHPEASIASGKVLPLWSSRPPDWLNKEHWSAIAMADYGDEEFYADDKNQICLLACAFRTDDVKAVGGYDSRLGVTRDQIGGTEDLEILQRLWSAGHRGIYLPHIWFHHKVNADRCTKKYHRRWHTGHGAFYASMREPEFERSSARFLDVPVHLYKQTFRDAGSTVKNLLIGKLDKAFESETRLRFFAGFFRTRLRDFRSEGNATIPSELASLASFLFTRRQ